LHVGTRGRLRALLAELCEMLESVTSDAGDELAALALADTLRKSRRAEPPDIGASLAKLADAIVPRLDALQRRVDDIARTPLPPVTAARAVTAISKRDDGGGAVFASGDIVAALAQMSGEERTLTLIKAAHANPITSAGRPAR
jgi:hypothetical protein